MPLRSLGLLAGVTIAWLLIGQSGVSYASPAGKSSECKKTKADNLERSTEIRWFIKGSVPEPVKKWFITGPSKDVLGEPRAPDRPREDYYLKAFEGPRISAKLREGKVEVKLLGDSKDLAINGGEVSGKAEEWLKWSWRYACGKDHTGNKLDGDIARGLATWTDQQLLAKVWKQRTERRFEKQPDGSFKPTSRIESSGVKAEVTDLEIGKDRQKWWTISMEFIGKKDDAPFETLQQGLAWVFKDYPAGSSLTNELSMSYPEWLSH